MKLWKPFLFLGRYWRLFLSQIVLWYGRCFVTQIEPFANVYSRAKIWNVFLLQICGNSVNAEIFLSSGWKLINWKVRRKVERTEEFFFVLDNFRGIAGILPGILSENFDCFSEVPKNFWIISVVIFCKKVFKFLWEWNVEVYCYCCWNFLVISHSHYILSSQHLSVTFHLKFLFLAFYHFFQNNF